jgi:rhamnose transport system permease protein
VVLAALAIGLLLGLINGYLVGYLDLPPIVVTLGTMSVYRGMVFVLSGGAWVSSHQMPADFVAFPLARLLGVTHLVWIAALVVLAAWYVARHSRFGRDLYAIGNAPSSARYVGIPIAQRRCGLTACPEQWRDCAATCGWRATRSPTPRLRMDSSSP